MNGDAGRFPAAPLQRDLFREDRIKIAARDVDTSQAAADALQRSIGEKLNVCLQAIRGAGARGLTADEVAKQTGISPFTTRPRCSQLASDDFRLIRDSGMRRANDSARMATVWVSIEFTVDDVKRWQDEHPES